MKKTLIALLLVASLPTQAAKQVSAVNSRSSPYPLPVTKKICKADFGDRWMLTVDSGYMTCDYPAVMFTTEDGECYSLNLAADNRGHKEIELILQDDPKRADLIEYAMWGFPMKTREEAAQDVGPFYKRIAPLRAAAQKLCKPIDHAD
ncbi:YebY family protein [Photobacterium profundum]|uniref:DUF2511 domain-containing protein n=1 Tax=Photobacterium profundum TaxID=74109 RepID=UPI003D140012